MTTTLKTAAKVQTEMTEEQQKEKTSKLGILGEAVACIVTSVSVMKKLAC